MQTIEMEYCESFLMWSFCMHRSIRIMILFSYYRVRVGDFRTRLEAEKFLRKISRKYPGAWVIQDYINFPKYKYEKL